MSASPTPISTTGAANLPSYAGVAGVMPGNAAAIAQVLTELDPDGSRLGDRKVAIGALASEKTLRGEQNKYPLRYPKREDIAGCFIDDPRFLNLVHVAADSEDGLGFATLAASVFGGKHCQGFQINFCWPSLGAAALARKHARDQWGASARIVLQVGPKAMDGITIPECMERLAAYGATITDALIDVSGGTNKPIQSCLIEGTAELFRGQFGRHGPGLGFAGSLSAERLLELSPVLQRAGGSVDVESPVRDDAPGGGNLDLAKVRAYLDTYLTITGGAR